MSPAHNWLLCALIVWAPHMSTATAEVMLALGVVLAIGSSYRVRLDGDE
jgi:hypothetical protein